jgi:pyruvate dehydrogenase E2 component (dihydrolipoamide acetyltransferase)
MLTEFKIPEVGENITSGTAVKISVTVGQTVKKDQALLELETDKATIEVPSSVAGVIKEILITEGAKVNIGQIVMKIEAGASTPEKTDPKAATPAAAAPATTATTTTSAAEKSEKPTAVAPTQTNTTAAAVQKTVAPPPSKAPVAQLPLTQIEVSAAPSVRRLARELGINIGEVPGTGPGGRISKDDVKAYTKRLISAAPSLGGGSVAVIPLPDFSKWGQS